MTLDTAIRLTEILLGFAFIIQSLEHLKSFRNEQFIFAPRLLLSVLLMMGIQTPLISALLLFNSLVLLYRFQGPYNGGADRMGLLVLFCLCLSEWLPSVYAREIAFGYLAVQLVLSYFISGWVKIVNPDWRSGQALKDVFLFSAYPVSESLRGWSEWPRLLRYVSWWVMSFELLFPFALFSQTALIIALFITASFHFSNACFFGLNRFFWVWIAAYPAILWFQERIFL